MPFGDQHKPDRLAAGSQDRLLEALKYIVVKDAPFKKLTDQMGKIGLAAKLSLVHPEWAVAVKVSEIAGQLLSHFLW
jgi:hypothetical protein